MFVKATSTRNLDTDKVASFKIFEGFVTVRYISGGDDVFEIDPEDGLTVAEFDLLKQALLNSKPAMSLSNEPNPCSTCPIFNYGQPNY